MLEFLENGHRGSAMGLISFFRHDIFRLHENPPMHPEIPDRLLAIDNAIAKSPVAGSLTKIEPRPAQENELCAVHSQSYLEQIERAAEVAKGQNKLIQLDGDTFLSPATLDAAKLAAGAGFKAVESLTDKKISSAFVAVRPPGHHALSNRQMGFCIYNNIALAAAYARRQLNYNKILIIDWDVHHGNGTQSIFYDDPSVLFISLHQYPFWPYDSGWYTEDGSGEGKGYNINIPLPGGTGDSGYLAAWDRVVAPVSLEYKPDLILVSAGYDAHQADPLGGQEVTSAGFSLLSERLRNLCEITGAKSACFLEGGYNTTALAESVIGTLSALSRDKAADAESNVKLLNADQLPKDVEERLSELRKYFSQYWPSCDNLA